MAPLSFMRPIKAQCIALNSKLHQTFNNLTFMEKTHEFHTVRNELTDYTVKNYKSAISI